MAKNNGDGTFTLGYDEYDYLIGVEAAYVALVEAGVDNWEGYHLAFQVEEDCN